MTEFVKKINESDLSPNEYLWLYCLKNGLELKNIDIEMETENLIKKGYLNDLGEPLENTLLSKELENKAFKAKIRRYQQLFPCIRLPFGGPARGKESQIRQKLEVFLSLYPYDWDIIYEATRRYVEHYTAKGYKYMKNASTFILDKNGDSDLATECEMVQNNEEHSTEWGESI